jgi:hypothetical protein
MDHLSYPDIATFVRESGDVSLHRSPENRRVSIWNILQCARMLAAKILVHSDEESELGEADRDQLVASVLSAMASTGNERMRITTEEARQAVAELNRGRAA